MFVFFFSDSIQRQLSEVNPVSEELSIALNRPIIESGTTISSEKTYTFDENQIKQSSSTIQKLFNKKHYKNNFIKSKKKK